MEINIKTLQLTQVEAAVSVDANTTPPVQGEVSVGQLPQLTAIEMVGEVDASTAPLIQEQILPLVQLGSKILLDLTKVPYMSSAGLRVLLSLYRQVSSKNGQLVLVGLSEEIRDTMTITGFLDFFTTCETFESAVEVLKAGIAE